MSLTGSAAIPQEVAATREQDALFRKITWRFLPVLFACYVFNYMDRTNIGFAQLQMGKDLGIGDFAYGFGAGILFVSYSIFGVPSNLILTKIGVRKTIFLCVVGWGLVSAATMFVRTPHEFYAARFLLGVFEGGFFPGAIFYFNRWYPSQRRGRIIGMFMSATVVAGVVSGILSAELMTRLAGVGALHGWQWLFLAEGVPSIILGIILYFYLDETPEDARWLSEEEKRFISTSLKEDGVALGKSSLAEVLLDWRVWVLGLIYFAAITHTYVLAFWQPRLIQDFGVSSIVAIGLYSTIPPFVAVLAKVSVPYHSDLKHERRWHFALSAFVGAAGLTLTTLYPHNAVFGIICLTIATAGVHACIPVFWAVPGNYFSGTGAAAAIAIISMVGTFGGAVGPPVMGYIKQVTGSFRYGMYLQSAVLILGGIVMLLVVSEKKAQSIKPQA